MQKKLYPFHPTPETLPLVLHGSAERRHRTRLQVDFFLRSSTGPLGIHTVVPSPVSDPKRMDELWKATCFEVFLGADSETNGAYQEYNFSPTRNWNAYSFIGERVGMSALSIPPPVLELEFSPTEFRLSARIAVPDAPIRVALSAVLAHPFAPPSYWAFAHLRGKPDFHAQLGDPRAYLILE